MLTEQYKQIGLIMCMLYMTFISDKAEIASFSILIIIAIMIDFAYELMRGAWPTRPGGSATCGR